MDEDKNEEMQDSQELSGLQKGMKTLSKKAKNVFSMIFRKIIAAIGAAPLIIKIVLLLIVVGVIISAFSVIQKLFGDNNVAANASKAIFQNEVEIAKVEDSDEGYYFKINSDIIDKFKKALNESYENGDYDVSLEIGEDDDEEIENIEDDDEDTDEEETEYDEDDAEYTDDTLEDWFQTDDKEIMQAYLVKMLRAEIASSYPKLGDYTGEAREDRQGNKQDKLGNYVAQGIVQIQRTRMNNEGEVEEAIPLTYLPYEQDEEDEDVSNLYFSELVQNNKPEALNYFSFDSQKGIIYYATYKEVVVTTNGVETSRTYTVQENSASYKSLTAMCSMPYNFTFSLLQISENPEWVMAVIDLLLKDSEVILMIQDQMNITTHTEVNYQVEKTTTQTLTGDSYEEPYENTTIEIPYWIYGPINTSYSFPAGEEERIITTTYTNTANVFIKKAKTWCMDFEQEAIAKTEDIPGEEIIYSYPDEDLAALSYPDTPYQSNRSSVPPPSKGATFTIIEKFLSIDRLLYSTKTDIKNYTWTISAVEEKRINYERFLGLWRNDTGSYYLGAEFKEDGIEVAYRLPEPNDNVKTYPSSEVTSSDSEEDIDTLIDLLSRHSDTQIHEQLMMYYWNKYYGKDVYDVNLDQLLDLFNTSIIIPLRGSAYNSLLELIRSQLAYWEGTGQITTNSEGKQCYVAYWDDHGQVVTIGHGVTTYEISYFYEYGITDINTGDLIEVEIVDAIELQIIQDNLNYIKGAVPGLEDYQYAALTIAYYNCPALVSGFAGRYDTYWTEADNKYGEELPYRITGGIGDKEAAEAMTQTLKRYVNSVLYSNGWADYCHSGGEALGGLVRRRYYEWMLFQYGYDVVSDTYYSSRMNDARLYNNDGSVNDMAMLEFQSQFSLLVGLEAEATNLSLDINDRVADLDNQAYWNRVLSIGAKWYGTNSNIFTASRNNTTSSLIFQCTWWAYGRASEYLEEVYGYTGGLPSAFSGNGGTFYSTNASGGYFNYGQVPKAHSIVSWGNGASPGHVAFVEAVDDNYIYISHAGGGKRWFGISKIPLSGYIWSGYDLKGYVYLDEPNNIF